MAGRKFWGSLNLDAIKDAIQGGVQPFEGKKGKYIPVNVWLNEEPDQFGNMVSIQIYNKDTKQATYLANLKESEFQGEAQSTPKSNSPDLPF